MSVYFIGRKKGWRYDFTLAGQRYTAAGFRKKSDGRQAENDKRKEITSPPKEVPATPTDMAFLELVNRRLDYVKAYNSPQHYAEYKSRAKRWVARWGELMCGELTRDMVERFVLDRSQVSAFTANKEICCLRATFNFGIKREWIIHNPVQGIDKLPLPKTERYVPSDADIEKVIAAAQSDEDREYLIVMRETLARSVEVNRLTWDDVDLTQRFVILRTRKKKGGHLTPRQVPMTDRLHRVLSGRFESRDKTKPWVFWHRYKSSKTGAWVEGPYQDRKNFMKTLCSKAGVRYFRFHPLRHSGASIMEQNGVPIGSIQKILGHESRVTTETYLHTLGGAEREAMSTFERAGSHTVTSAPQSHTQAQKSHTNSPTRPKTRLRLVK